MAEAPPTAARLALESELPQVWAITAAAYAQYAPILDAPPLPVTEDPAPYLRAGNLFLVSHGGADVGALLLETHPDHTLIFSLALLPQAQGAGIGRWMLAFAEDRARAAGHDEIRLYTNPKMTRNLAIYERAGYRETARRPNPARPGWTLVDMAKPLPAPASAPAPAPASAGTAQG